MFCTGGTWVEFDGSSIPTGAQVAFYDTNSNPVYIGRTRQVLALIYLDTETYTYYAETYKGRFTDEIEVCFCLRSMTFTYLNTFWITYSFSHSKILTIWVCCQLDIPWPL
jgi:hypothetical protein